MDFRGKKTASRLDEEAGEYWLWVSWDPHHRLILAHWVGRHDEMEATALMRRTQRVLSGPLPLFVSDGWDAYIEALLACFFRILHHPPTGQRGRPRNPQRVPDPELRYAQVVKAREKGRVVGVHKRIIFGKKNKIKMEEVTTSLIERQNLNFRQYNRRLHRKTIGFSKSLNALRDQVRLFVVYSNFVRPHRALRIKVNEKVRGNVRRKWRPRTPAMSAGLTDHIWSLKELLMFKPLISTN